MDATGFDANKLAKAVRTHRKAAGLTQAELAERAGLAFETVSRIESGREPPSLKTTIRLADALGLQLDEVVGRVVSAKRPEKVKLSPSLRQLISAAKNVEPRPLRALVTIARSLGPSRQRRGR